MKKMFIMLIGILVISMIFTACGAPVETPTNVESSLAQTAESVVQSEEQQEDAMEENDTVSVASKTVENNDKDVVSKETQTEKEPVETASKETSKTTTSKVVDQPNENADAVANPTPEFTSVAALQNWMLSKDDTDQYAQDKQALLSTMATGNQIVYYRPAIGNGNDAWQLERVSASHGVLHYYYKFVDDAYNDLQLVISCYLDDSFKENYLEALDDLEKQVYGYASAEVNNHQVLYRDNQFGTTNFLWQQFGGYIYASLKGENHADKVQEVLPYLNLEKVTLRTDLETQ